jgi:hypothetical protein
MSLGSEETFSYHVGQWFAVLLFSIPAAACLHKAIRTPAGSLRYSYLSAFMGFLVLVQIEIPLSSLRSRPGMVFLLGLARSLIAAIGLICTLRALVLRRADHGVGWLAPGAGAVLCGIHGLYALTLFILPTVVRSGAEGEAWTYRSEVDGYAITLPSRQWVQGKMEGASSVFHCRLLQARVAVFARRQTPEEFRASIQSFKGKEMLTLQEAQSEKGKTPAGHEYFLVRGTEKQQAKRILVTMGHLYRQAWGQTLTFIGEAEPNMSSQMGQAAQASAGQDALWSIFCSLK